jgi:hypothetical protein
MAAGGCAAKRKWMIRTGNDIEDSQSEADNRRDQKECTHSILSNQGVLSCLTTPGIYLDTPDYLVEKAGPLLDGPRQGKPTQGQRQEEKERDQSDAHRVIGKRSQITDSKVPGQEPDAKKRRDRGHNAAQQRS